MTDRGKHTPYDIALGSFAHPRQIYLRTLLKDPNLPEGASELIRKAIAEYDVVFGQDANKKFDPAKETPSTFFLSIPSDGEDHVLLAGKIHTLSTRFQGDVESGIEEELLSHQLLVVNLRNMPGANIYPDRYRYMRVDVKGNSQTSQFLVDIPEGLRGYNSAIAVEVFNGARKAIQMNTDLQLR